jgi:hypothetical protein
VVGGEVQQRRTVRVEAPRSGVRMPERPDDEQPVDERRNGRYWQEKAQDDRTGRSAAAERIRNQTHWVDLQVRRAMERGEFDDLPGAGKPMNLPEKHDPDWWVKKLIEREQITGIAPAAISLRLEDAELDSVLDREATEDGVRRVVEDFNRRIVEARRQLTGGPPVITPTRDADNEVEAWRQRREQRRAARRRQDAVADPKPQRRRWWRRR